MRELSRSCAEARRSFERMPGNSSVTRPGEGGRRSILCSGSERLLAIGIKSVKGFGGSQSNRAAISARSEGEREIPSAARAGYVALIRCGACSAPADARTHQRASLGSLAGGQAQDGGLYPGARDQAVR